MCREAIFEPKNRIDEVAGKCETVSVTNQAANILRENTGTSGIVESARAAVAVLADNIFIVGNLDEAYNISGNMNPDIDADTLMPNH